MAGPAREIRHVEDHTGWYGWLLDGSFRQNDRRTFIQSDLTLSTVGYINCAVSLLPLVLVGPARFDFIHSDL